MHMADLGGHRLHYRIDGPDDGVPVVFANSLGTDLTLWDPILPHLPKSLRILRFDKRGHGNSDCPPGPWSMGALVRDTEQLMDQTGFKDAIFVGLSIGGMIAQGLAAKRLDLIRAVVLSNTGAKIGTRAIWDDRIKATQEGGLEAVVEANMQRWFSRKFRDSDAFPPWRDLFLRTPVTGWTGCASAISGTDFFSTTAALRLPALAIAGSEDGSTPPDLVRETGGLIPGSKFELIRGAGHLPCVDHPERYAEILTEFITSQGLL